MSEQGKAWHSRAKQRKKCPSKAEHGRVELSNAKMSDLGRAELSNTKMSVDGRAKEKFPSKVEKKNV